MFEFYNQSLNSEATDGEFVIYEVQYSTVITACTLVFMKPFCRYLNRKR